MNAMYPNHRMADELAAVEYRIAAVTQRIEVIDALAVDGTGTDDDDRNAQDERRDLQRQYDQLELRRDQLELVLPMPIFTGTLTKAEAQALMDAHDIRVLLGTDRLDGDELQLLLQSNPTLASAYTTIELIANYGKP